MNRHVKIYGGKLFFYILTFEPLSLTTKFSIIVYGTDVNFFAMTQLTFRSKKPNFSTEALRPVFHGGDQLVVQPN